jgi:serine/threonine protein kinase
VPSGSLLDRLRPPHPPLTAPQRLQILQGIAYGLLALHDADLVHLDVKPANILLALLGGGIVAKLTDFGISKSLDPTSTFAGSTMGGAGSLMWMAPELHRRPAAPSPAADVYAFGMVMYELYTGCQPWDAELQASGVSPMMVTAWVLDGRRPSIPGHVPQPSADLMQQCWAAAPSQRPSLSHIVTALSESIARLNAGSSAVGVSDSPPTQPALAAASAVTVPVIINESTTPPPPSAPPAATPPPPSAPPAATPPPPSAPSAAGRTLSDLSVSDVALIVRAAARLRPRLHV